MDVRQAAEHTTSLVEAIPQITIDGNEAAANVAYRHLPDHPLHTDG